MDFRNCPRFIEVDKYLTENRIEDLLSGMTCLLLYHQPENPYEFMVTLLEKLSRAQLEGGYNPWIFSTLNAATLYSMMDVNRNGYITYEQYEIGLGALGISKYDIMPVGIGQNQISYDTFMDEARKGLDILSSTYKQMPDVEPAHVEIDPEENTETPELNCE